MEDYTVNDGPANFIIQVKRKGEGQKTSWVVLHSEEIAAH